MKKTLSLILLLPFFLSGCGSAGSIRESYSELSRLQLIQTIGLDGGSEELTLTVASGEQSDGLSPSVVSQSAGSMVEAINDIQDHDPSEQVFFSHVRYVIAGEEYAREGLGSLFDFIERDVRMRMGTELFILRGAEAKALITGQGSGSFNINNVLDSVKRDVNQRGDSHVFSIRETVRSLGESGSALVCALRYVSTEGSVFMTEPGLSAVPDGYAIINAAALVGYISSRDAVAAGLLMGKLGAAAISVDDGSGAQVTLEVTGGSVSVKPRWASDGELECITVEAELKAAVAELSGISVPLDSSEYIASLESALSLDIKKRILSVLDASSRLDADFLGLSSLLHWDDPANFEALPEDWLSDAVFRVSVKSAIDRSYDLGEPVKNDGSGK